MLDQDELLQHPKTNTMDDSDHKILVALLSKIIVLLNKKEAVSIDNFDEVKAHLRNELNLANKSLSKNISFTSDNRDVVDEIKTLTKTIRNKKSPKLKLPDIRLPDIKIPDIRIPDVKVEPIINIPNFDTGELLKAVEDGLKRIRTNNKSNPLAVRLTDGADWIRELKTIVDRQEKAITQYLSDVSYIKNAAGQTINPATEDGQSYMLVPKVYDYISLNPANNPTTIIYKTGGASGTTVATLTLTYSGSNVTSVTRT